MQLRHKHGNRASHARRTPATTRTLDVLAQYSHELRNSLGTIRNAMRVLGGATAGSPTRERSRILVLRQVD